MFHLFNQVYLDFDFNLEFTDRIIISELYCKMEFDDDVSMIAKTHDELLETFFNSDEESLWTFLTNIPADKKFVIYVPQDEFFKYLIKYFRALFTKASDESLYVIYRLTMLKYRMIIGHFMCTDDDHQHCLISLDILTKPQFLDAVKDIPRITAFTPSIRQTVGVDLLLPSYLADGYNDYNVSFENRAEIEIWEDIIGELNEFRQNSITGFFDIGTIYPNMPPIDYETFSFANAAQSHPELIFLQNYNLNFRTLDTTKNQVDLDVVFEHYYKLLTHIGDQVGMLDKFLLAYQEFVSTRNTESTAVRVKKLIDLDISTAYGSQIFGRSIAAEKVNPFLFSLFYDMARNDRTNLDQYII